METQPTNENDPLQRLVGERTVAEWHGWLTGDDLDVPASRYGRTASEVAWWPLATLHVFEQYSDIDSSYEVFLNGEMSLAVNDADSVIEIVMDNREAIPAAILANLTVEGEPL